MIYYIIINLYISYLCIQYIFKVHFNLYFFLHFHFIESCLYNLIIFDIFSVLKLYNSIFKYTDKL